ncbi:hypothetical protein MNV_2060001 [Candidatus Methanoperedens nitroreducens]|uniref:Uncharacterized protein n=1 Tax=Candidatus Methanoperedens nitratireducens TaxID=1392998 RepID=A0A284VNR7_9EURY|nr:hypothetical protein MNV_2060001 [Candidatus Methanoperedens nitroreducens]
MTIIGAQIAPPLFYPQIRPQRTNQTINIFMGFELHLWDLQILINFAPEYPHH